MAPITVNFYRTTDPYGSFSNFSRHEIRLDELIWPTSEHFFQAAKFSLAADREAVRMAPTPFAAAEIGRQRDRSFRPDWDRVRDDIMLKVLRAKFSQHDDLRELLASTCGARLVEHTDNDSYWADGGDGHGANRLGQLLEQVRDELCPHAKEMIAPLWIQFPGIENSDLFFRMGHGESRASAHEVWYWALPAHARAEYDAYFPEPGYWRRRSQAQ